MGIWIRTHDKSNLLELNGFSIYEDDGDIEVRGFQTSSNDDETWTLGVYSTQEKALKVLDIIKFQIEMQTNLVFEMPQDSEVE